jgi:hypothetical protein
VQVKVVDEGKKMQAAGLQVYPCGFTTGGLAMRKIMPAASLALAILFPMAFMPLLYNASL